MIRERHLNALVLGALLALPLWGFWAEAPFMITLATRAAILALAAVGLNLALGLGGLVSLGHAAFFGVGGYAAGILALHAQSFTPMMTWPITIQGTTSMPLIWLVAVVASALAALGIGALSLRTSGVYFIMITLAFGQMLYYFAVALPAYGGEDGVSIYVRNAFPGLNTLRPLPFFAICYVLLGLALLLSWRISVSPFGLALSAARQSEARVRTVGIEPYRLRLVAFVISGAITGLAGALFADLNRFVSPAMLSWHLSGEFIVLVVLGGVGRLLGPVVGAGLFVFLEHWLGGVSDHWMIFLGAALLLVVLFARGGLIGGLTAGSRS
ncbi:branched-chain amino acid ABC transporter permease [Rubellimicrobium roseum]|uniref:Branched-chain amino acid ABC transporter permease n=1 Tax=Rubellimicrobium roseum TaxID=687525 RepID=A0A5C4N891_9RHOB|nr:branched-chain amino acid ABC transporter permease [Rubellimicrobium roseum]TNC60699.1 branched-chain amino acid ABC transporter permease [Rubellimicrobium roseum]